MPDVLPSRDERDWLPTDLDLDRLQWTTLLYDLHETNPDNGLVRDKTDLAARAASPPWGWPSPPCRSSSSALVCRPFAAKMARRRLRFLHELPRVPSRTPRGTKASSTTSSTSRAAAASGSASCRRLTRRSCFAGMLTAAAYFDHDTAEEGRGPPPGRRALPPGRLELGAERRANAHARLRPESGFLPYRWEGYDEGCCCTCSAWARRPTRCPRELCRLLWTYEWKQL